MISQSTLHDQQAFTQMLVDENITHLHATPGFISLLEPGTYGGLKRVVAAGEACPPSLANNWRKLVKFYNKYGPTESTISAAEFLVNDEVATVPIGKPLPNTTAYILDKAMKPVGVGITGEIYLGGAQLARGYLNQPALTAEKFVTVQGRRMYRTGDLGYWLPNGEVVFIGRADSQVKVRGYRIELGEIESVLRQQEEVKDAIVMVTETGLCAYVIGAVDKDAVAKALPSYMVPTHYVQLEKFPL